MAEQAKTAEGAKVEAPDTNAEAKAQAEKVGAKKQAKTAEGKVYNFKSTNKFLSCVGLGVQFMDGKASTTKLEVAKELVKLDGVELVEE